MIASEIVIFGGLFASVRHAPLGAWSGATMPRTPTPGPAPSTRSWSFEPALSAVLAHQAAERGNGKRAQILLRLPRRTRSSLIVKAFEWTHEITRAS